MKQQFERAVIYVVFMLSGFVFLYAQTEEHANKTNSYCHQAQLLEAIQANKPDQYARLLSDWNVLSQHIRDYIPTKDNTIYTIPVVFHVIHNGGLENISNEQIYDALAILNRDFRRLNADADLVKTEFLGMPADVHIQFKLATKAPDGTCFNGITRTQSPLTTYTGALEDFGQIIEVFAKNDVYRGMWSHEKYLNIVVGKSIGGAGGYTNYPNNEGTYMNTIFMLHSSLGSIGTGSIGTSRSLTHEVGHWLNLMHTWGDSNTPGHISNCDIDDGVDDTPNSIGLISCNLHNSSCGVLANTENYMEYSYCSKMFTAGQVERMRASIISPIGARNGIWTEENLQQVGAVDQTGICRVDFYTSKRHLCVGDSVLFEDRNAPDIQDWLWDFPGGEPSSSTEKHPIVSYNMPGTYAVSLTIKNSTDEKTVTKTDYITVLKPYVQLPFHEGFEFYQTIENSSNKLFVESLGDSISFQVNDQASYTGEKSAVLRNFHVSQIDNVDNLISTPIDLSSDTIQFLTFSYRYVHRNKTANVFETFKVYFSGNCGHSWQERSSFSKSNLSGNPIETTEWFPSSPSDWVTAHIPFNMTSFAPFLTENFRFKFEFIAKGGNSIYLDDINLYSTTPSDEVLTNPQDSIDYYNQQTANLIDNDLLGEIRIFPNPTSDGQVQLMLDIPLSQKITIRILDLSGKVLLQNIIMADQGHNYVQLDISTLQKGLYFVELSGQYATEMVNIVRF